ncbi:MAG: methyltransferase domain-containing protein [Gemmatimonadota bacterium]|nr:methyltransferase domain-containing protein [Gemmatimonadota bacterium]
MTEAPGHPGEPYFAAVADRLGEAYLRYNFTKGTSQEVAFLIETLRLPPGARILDVGCGPGRHAVALAQAGLSVTGVDVSARFLDIAADAARSAGVRAAFFEVDARRMPFDDEFDAVISLCQGAFGLMGRDDSLVLKRMAEAARPGGRVVVTAFSALYEARHPRSGAAFDADAGLVHELAEITTEDGSSERVDLWTGVYTPRELRLLALGVGLIPEKVWAVEPGGYARRAADLERPELMLVARRPSGRS